jgi:hypothetical protein
LDDADDAKRDAARRANGVAPLFAGCRLAWGLSHKSCQWRQARFAANDLPLR